MPSKKAKQKLMKRRIGSIARVIACASFLVLTIIGVSSIVRAMSLETIANENGIPASWKAASLGNPDTITVPITYWDQRMDPCNADNRQFEWTACHLYAKGIIPDVVQSRLGADGLPVPSYSTYADAWASYHDIFTANVIGHNPVLATDNFYRWFHEAYDTSGKQISKRYNREVTFRRTGNNTYEYGSRGTFPLDNVDFSRGDSTNGQHNFHFTAHLRIPMKIAANGQEKFSFSGDDDVWVFLNGRLVLDLGGLHSDTPGYFIINQNGSITSVVNDVNDQQCRQEKIPDPNTVGNDIYNNRLSNCALSTKTYTIDAGLKPDDVVNLDFFYAERSTSESNTRITISNMNWPISADSNLDAKVVGKIEATDSNLVQFTSSITNRDPENPLNIERIAAYVEETDTVVDQTGATSTQTQNGYLPLSNTTLFYSATPDDPDSWQPVEISAPENSSNGFKLATPLELQPSGKSGDTLHFRYFADTAELSGTMNSTISYYTTLNGVAGITYDHSAVTYETSRGYHQVKINYLYEDGTPAAPTYTATYRKDDAYEVDSPEIEGYRSDIAKVTGTVQDSDIEYTVYYKLIPEEPEPLPKHTIIVKYIYADGSPAAESYTAELEESSTYQIISPTITDFVPDQETISGTVGTEDAEFTVVYTSTKPVVPDQPEDPTPETPDIPSKPENPTPETPSEPNTPLPPVLPNLPSSDIIDGELTYVDPLGEVAYVPNTGIINDAVAAIFEVEFAAIILSQGFVMVVLLIFASSFATWFSLRKYMNVELATRTIKKSHPKMPANKKVVRAKVTARNAHASRKTKK